MEEIPTGNSPSSEKHYTILKACLIIPLFMCDRKHKDALWMLSIVFNLVQTCVTYASAWENLTGVSDVADLNHI